MTNEVHSESKSEDTESAHTIWFNIILANKQQCSESKLRVSLVLDVLTKLMVSENSIWEFPKVPQEVHLVFKTLYRLSN